MMGADYSLFFPSMLDGVFWYKVNGLTAVPWFTPAFGGGLPKFPNPQSVYYSVEQFLCFITDPLTSIKITLFLFAFLGFYGFYLLLKRIFSLSPSISLLGATIFLFNGFFINRMIMGHVTFHPFMLFPMFMYLLLRYTQKDGKTDVRKFIADIVFASLILIYMIYSGAFHIIPPMVLTLVICALVYNLFVNAAFGLGRFFLKLSFTLIISLCVSAAYFNATFSYINLFPRDLYPLPGVPNLWNLLQLWFRALFFNSPFELAKDITVNRIWQIGPHEMEFGVGLLPLIILIIAVPFLIKRIFTGGTLQRVTAMRWIKLFLLLVLLAVPLALNFYTPSWNAFLKSLPFIKSSSSNFRWFCCYIPIVILISCVALEKIKSLHPYRFYIMTVGILFIVFTNIFKDRAFYRNLDYKPDIILDAYKDLKAGKLKPEIAYIDEAIMKGTDTVRGGDVIALGSSQLKPYEPIFGYRWENYPKKTLVAGKAMQVNQDGFLNLKNPAGYVFPKENGIEPGDHFKAGEAEKADRFRRYLKFPFKFSASQKFANAVTQFSLIAFALCFVFFIMQNLYAALVPEKKKVVKHVTTVKKSKR
ncbi:MAG TPA: hypothetical protein VKB95_12580 [Chitinophagaceae bacterium]|nr:hypothetical protein [Chitinophagaceae bacterium]